MTATVTLRYGKGYRGKLGEKCWVAEIVGSDPTYGFKRVFLEPVKVEREHFNRPRSIVNFTYELEPDRLYELSEGGDRQFVMCFATREGVLKVVKVSDARVRAWVAALDEGRSNREARLASKGL